MAGGVRGEFIRGQGQRQGVEPASFGVRKSEMSEAVRGYVENLEGQIQGMMREFGVGSVEELQGVVDQGNVSVEDLEKVVGLVEMLAEVVESGELSKEMQEEMKRDPWQLDLREKIADKLGVDFVGGFHDGFAKVKQDDKWFFVDEKETVY